MLKRRRRLIRHNKYSTRTQIFIGTVQRGLIPGSEVIRWNGNSICETYTYDTVTVVDCCRRRRRGSGDRIIAVSSGNVDASGGVGSKARTGSPYAVAFPVWRSAPHSGLGQSGFVVAQEPAMPGTIVSMRGKPDINEPVKQKKTRALIRPLRVQWHRRAIAIGSRPWHRSSHQYRTTQFLRTRSDVDSMEPINNIAAL